MLVIHAGMPKTGTTVLQYALANSAQSLATIDLVYPHEFRDREGLAHHALSAEILSEVGDSGPLTRQWLEFLNGSRSKRVLISSEAFTNCLNRQKILPFIRFLAACGERMPVRLVLALRRMDTFFESMYLHSVKVGEHTQEAGTYFEARFRWAQDFFSQLSVLRNIGILESVILVRHEKSPLFTCELLDAFKLKRAEHYTVKTVLSGNEKLGLKAQSFLLHLPHFEAKLGERIDRQRIIQALELKQFSFPGDTNSYSIMERWQRLYFHESALRAAMQFSIREYNDFFASQKIESKSSVSLSPDLICNEDIEAIRAFLKTKQDRQAAGAI